MITDLEKVTLLQMAHHAEKRGEHSYARIVRNIVQRLAPDARLVDRTKEVQQAFGTLAPRCEKCGFISCNCSTL
jgi:hypothetical protein